MVVCLTTLSFPSLYPICYCFNEENSTLSIGNQTITYLNLGQLIFSILVVSVKYLGGCQKCYDCASFSIHCIVRHFFAILEPINIRKFCTFP